MVAHLVVYNACIEEYKDYEHGGPSPNFKEVNARVLDTHTRKVGANTFVMDHLVQKSGLHAACYLACRYFNWCRRNKKYTCFQQTADRFIYKQVAPCGLPTVLGGTILLGTIPKDELYKPAWITKDHNGYRLTSTEIE
jgi:hypothetical protein